MTEKTEQSSTQGSTVMGLQEVFGRMMYGDRWRDHVIGSGGSAQSDSDPLVERAKRAAFAVFLVLSMAVVFMIGLGCLAAWQVVVGVVR